MMGLLGLRMVLGLKMPRKLWAAGHSSASLRCYWHFGVVVGMVAFVSPR
jgi:hypothetical protein